MLTSVNKVVLIGTVGDKIELRHLDKGGAICRFTLLTSDSFTDKSSGEKKKVNDYHTVTSWGDQAKEVYKKIKKSQQLYIDAKLKSRTWQSKEGVTHRGYELFLESFLILNTDNTEEKSIEHYSTLDTPDSPTPLSGFQINDLDELPF